MSIMSIDSRFNGSYSSYINYILGMLYTKIITHSGQFHADEVLAIALLRLIGCEAPIERTYTPTPEDFADSRVFVLDVGKQYDPKLGNFDHHQDQQLPATNRLLLAEVGFLLGPGITDALATRLFDRVSDVDRGRVVFFDATPLPEFNMLVRAFNNVPDGFDRALSVVTEILVAQVETARKALADEVRWDELVKANGIAYQSDNDPILCWKEKAKLEGIFMLVCPNLRGGYSVISRDTNELVIPAVQCQTFLHASGFMATYPTRAEAVEHAQSLVPASV